MPLDTGSRLGPYEILAPIGAGGMGEVYRARDTKLKRDVALKVLPDSFAGDSDRMARFQREAEVLAALNHTNIAAIYGVEQRALVMELVDGEELKGPLPIETAVNYASQIALALAAAHEKGIVHRDLKPANVKITPSGVVKVLDFGLAAVATDPSGADQQNSPTLTIRATQAGFIMGTAGYMSPEQAAGKPVDRRADIWSFGVVLWEMLTGKRLFDGETVSHTLAAVLTKDPDWTQLPSATPANVRRLLRRCLERDLKRRLHDMGDAWIELNSVDEALPAPETIKPSSVGRSLPWAIGALLAAGGIGWGLLHSLAQRSHPVVHSSYTEQNPFGMPAISRDGTRLAYSEFASGTLRLMLRMMDQTDVKPLPGTETGGVPAFSPDGQWLAYTSGFTSQSPGNRLQKIALNGGGAPMLMCDCPASWGLNWGDDHSIVFSDGKKLMRISDSGGTPQVLTTPDSKKGETGHVFPSFLPGMKRVLFAITSGVSSQVAVLDLKKGEYHGIGVNGTNPQYVSAGYLTYVRGGTLFAAPFNAKHGVVTGSEAAVLNGIASVLGSDNADYAVSEDGILIYMSGASVGSSSVLSWVDRKGIVEPISEPRHWGNGRLSPDGLRVADSLQDYEQNAGKSTDIWMLDVERRTLTRLTFGGFNSDPVWTPDGRHIAYYSSGGGTNGIYWLPADGSGKPELLAATDSKAVPSSWTADGKTLIFTQAGADKVAHIWLLPVSGDRKPALWQNSPIGESSAQVSPDGRYVAYVSKESGNNEVYVQPFPGPGAKIRMSTEGGIMPRWAHNGRELFYWVLPSTVLMAVDVQPGAVFHAGLPHEVVKTFSGTTWDVAPDGKRFLIETFTNGLNMRLETVVNWFDELRRRVPAR